MVNRFKIWGIVLLSLTMGCPGSDTVTINNNGGFEPPTLHISDEKVKIPCEQRDSTACEGKSLIGDRMRQCYIDDKDACTVATECTHLPSDWCSDLLLDGKSCETKGGKCVDKTKKYTCSTLLTKADCTGKPSDGGYNHICAWHNRSSTCRDVFSAHNYASQLTGGGGTVCANTNFYHEDDWLCWGDDTGAKYSKMGPGKIKRLAFASNYACSEVELKAPTSHLSNDGEYGVRCWGANANVVNNMPPPNFKIEKQSLQVNEHVACVEHKDVTGKDRVRCWGDFTGMTSPNPQKLSLNAAGDLQREGVVYLGSYILEASRFALGKDFICAEGPHVSGILNARELLCSGQTSFQEMKSISNPDILSDLTAFDSGFCYLKSNAADRKKLQCATQPGNALTYTRSPLSIVQYDWVEGMDAYYCGWELSMPGKLTCSVTMPATLTPPVGVTFGRYNFLFGPNYMCGIETGSRKVDCWGTDANIVGAIPASIKR